MSDTPQKIIDDLYDHAAWLRAGSTLGGITEPVKQTKAAIAQRLRRALDRITGQLRQHRGSDSATITVLADDLHALVEAIDGRRAG